MCKKKIKENKIDIEKLKACVNSWKAYETVYSSTFEEKHARFDEPLCKSILEYFVDEIKFEDRLKLGKKYDYAGNIELKSTTNTDIEKANIPFKKTQCEMKQLFVMHINIESNHIVIYEVNHKQVSEINKKIKQRNVDNLSISIGQYIKRPIKKIKINLETLEVIDE